MAIDRMGLTIDTIQDLSDGGPCVNNIVEECAKECLQEVCLTFLHVIVLHSQESPSLVLI